MHHYCRQADDRTFYKAAGLLRRAEGAANGAERGSLAAQALQLMGRVPAAVDLGVVVPQLALLGAWDGVVSLPLQVCAHDDQCRHFRCNYGKGMELWIVQGRCRSGCASRS